MPQCGQAVWLFGICTFPFNCHQLADHLVEIDDLAVVSEDVLSIEVHMFPADRTDLLDAVGQLDILLALRILEELGQGTSVVGLNIDVSRGNLSDENCACRRQNLRFLESFRKIYSNRNRFCGQFLRHVFAPYSSKVKSSQNLRVLRTNPASCLPMSNRRVGHQPGVSRP